MAVDDLTHYMDTTSKRRREAEQLREALKTAAQALAEASTELDALGAQRAASYAAEQNRIAWDAASAGETT